MSQPAFERSEPCVEPTARQRWERAWEHRDMLLRVARRRTLSEDEAQDAVSEAMLRSVQVGDLDDSRLAAWLTRVTINLCIDAARERARWPRRVDYTYRHLVPEPSPEQTVVDRDSAANVVQRLNGLPRRQRDVIMMRAAGLPLDDIAGRLGVSYKTVESLLSRARVALRGALAAAVLAASGFAHVLRKGAKAAPAATATAVAAVVTVTVLPADVPDATPPPRSSAVLPLQLDAKHLRPLEPARARAGSAPQARRQPQAAIPRPANPTPRPPVIRSHTVGDTRLGVETAPVTRERGSETFHDTVLWCIRRGVVVSSAYVGCRP